MDNKKAYLLGGIGLAAVILLIVGIMAIASAVSYEDDESYGQQPTIIINNLYQADEQSSSYQPIQPLSTSRDTGNTYYSNTYYSTSYASRYPRHYTHHYYYPYYPYYYSYRDPFYYGPGIGVYDKKQIWD